MPATSGPARTGAGQQQSQVVEDSIDHLEYVQGHSSSARNIPVMVLRKSANGAISGSAVFIPKPRAIASPTPSRTMGSLAANRSLHGSGNSLGSRGSFGSRGPPIIRRRPPTQFETLGDSDADELIDSDDEGHTVHSVRAATSVSPLVLGAGTRGGGGGLLMRPRSGRRLVIQHNSPAAPGARSPRSPSSPRTPVRSTPARPPGSGARGGGSAPGSGGRPPSGYGFQGANSHKSSHRRVRSASGPRIAGGTRVSPELAAGCWLWLLTLAGFGCCARQMVGGSGTAGTVPHRPSPLRVKHTCTTAHKIKLYLWRLSLTLTCNVGDTAKHKPRQG